MNNLSLLLTNLSKIANNLNYDISYILSQLSKVIDNDEILQIFLDSMSDGQIESKKWLVDNVENINLGNVFLCAGWLSTLFFDKRLKFNKCVNIDINEQSVNISKILNKKYLIDNWKFQAVTENIHDINYEEHHFNFNRSDNTKCLIKIKPDTIINTSCEHIENFNKWFKLIPNKKLLILQSNNGFDIPEHINCVKNLSEFKKQTPLTVELYSGKKEMPKFTRFMRIGYK